MLLLAWLGPRSLADHEPLVVVLGQLRDVDDRRDKAVRRHSPQDGLAQDQRHVLVIPGHVNHITARESTIAVTSK
jgi:hypothetical protein